MEETKRLSQKCLEVNFESLSVEEIDRVKYLFLDYLGVAIRGTLYDSSRPVFSLIQKLGIDNGKAVVIGTDFKTIPTYAALANGITGHSPELDDVVNESSLHPGVVVFPTALAAAGIGFSKFKDFAPAVIAGYDVVNRLAISLNPDAPYERGFHPTSTCGTMGSAVTAGLILGLNQENLVHALGIAGSQASGSMEFLADGAFTKRFHAGWAAQSGIVAAQLAAEGFTGPQTILEGKYGFLHSYANVSHVERILANWGEPFYIMRTSIKPHSCCRYKQGPIDGVLQLMRENQLEPADIEQIKIGVLKAGFSLVAEPREQKINPESIVDAQFSMPFGAAVAALFGQASLGQYTMDNVNSDRVKEVMEKVVCVEDASLDLEFPRKWPASVSISTKDGKSYSTRIDYPKGDPENPLSWEELIDKFKFLVSPVFIEQKANEIVDAVRSLEENSDITAITKLTVNTPK